MREALSEEEPFAADDAANRGRRERETRLRCKHVSDALTVHRRVLLPACADALDNDGRDRCVLL